jgi:hypothetical protein
MQCLRLPGAAALGHALPDADEAEAGPCQIMSRLTTSFSTV